MGLLALLLSRPLALEYYALELFKYRKVLIGVIDFCISLAFAYQETDFFHAFKFALDIASIFLYELCQSAHVGLKIRILSINHNDFAPDS